MRFKDHVGDDDKIELLHFRMGDLYQRGGDFYLFKLPTSNRYQTKGWACYDGYIRNQYDNFDEAYAAFQGWVDERLPDVINILKEQEN